MISQFCLKATQAKRRGDLNFIVNVLVHISGEKYPVCVHGQHVLDVVKGAGAATVSRRRGMKTGP